MAEMILAFFDYGYEVKILEGKNQKGYVIGVSEDGKIEISLREKPYSGEHHIIEPVSNLEILELSNPYKIWQSEIVRDKKGGGHELTDKFDKQSPFFRAKLKILAENPEIIINYPEYFTALPKDDWIELAEKRLYGKWEKIKKYYNKIFNNLFNRTTKEEIRQRVESLTERLYEEDNK